MSILNWMEMVKKGIAGDETVTCFVAALDCLSDNNDIPYKVYAKYTSAYLDQIQFGVDRRNSRNIFRYILEHSIGSSCTKNFVAQRAGSFEDFSKIVNNAVIGNKKIIIEVEASHVVGIRSIGKNLWIMVGNSIPCDDELTTMEVFSFLYIPPRTEKKEDQKNVYLLN